MKKQASSTPRYKWVDSLRGLAILLVMLGHVDTCPDWLRIWISSFHLPLFYVISGMLDALSVNRDKLSVSKQLLHRAYRLLWPYMTFSLLMTVYYGIMSGSSAALHVLRYTLTFEGWGTLWFLPASFFSECLFIGGKYRFCLPVLLRMAIWALISSTASLWLYWYTGCVDPLTCGPVYVFVTIIGRACTGAFFISFGFEFGLRIEQLKSIKKKIIVIVSLTMLAAGAFLSRLCGMADLHYGWLGQPALFYLSSTLECSAWVALFVCVLPGNRLLTFFGRNSLTVMATHYAFPIFRYAAVLLAALGCKEGAFTLAGVFLLSVAAEAFIVFAVNRAAPFMVKPPVKK